MGSPALVSQPENAGDGLFAGGTGNASGEDRFGRTEAERKPVSARLGLGPASGWSNRDPKGGFWSSRHREPQSAGYSDSRGDPGRAGRIVSASTKQVAAGDTVGSVVGGLRLAHKSH